MVRLAAVLTLTLLVPQDHDKRRNELSAKLESLRGLKFKSPLVLREGTRKEYAAYVLENAKRVYGADLPAAEKAMKALGLIPQKLRLDVAITAQAGFGTKVFCTGGEVVLLDAQAGDDWVLNKMDLGLVDQHFPAPARATFDGAMAWSALRMGDAEVVKHLLYGAGKITEETLKKAADDAAAWEKGDSKLASAVAPRIFVRTGDFTWRRGAVFALTQHLRGKLDQAYASPPESTEQILHPDKYAKGEKPVVIAAAPVDEFMKAGGFKTSYRTVFGELGVALVLESHFSRDDLSSVSEGWGGDVLLLFEKEGATPVLLWITDWDSEEDAIEFQAQLFRLMKKIVPADSEFTTAAVREKTTVVFDLNAPKDLHDGLVQAAFQCPKQKGRNY